MAWSLLISHPRAIELTVQDIYLVRDNLKDKVRCYGFGAVLDRSEVKEVIQNLFNAKAPSRIKGPTP